MAMAVLRRRFDEPITAPLRLLPGRPPRAGAAGCCRDPPTGGAPGLATPGAGLGKAVARQVVSQGSLGMVQLRGRFVRSHYAIPGVAKALQSGRAGARFRRRSAVRKPK
jgi:hypothetical protein